MPTPTPRQKAGTAAAAISAAVLVIAPVTMAFEGWRNRTYYDPAHILTACVGHTGPEVVAGKTYSDAECKALLDIDLNKHAEGIARCLPQHIIERRYIFAASVDFAFNGGVTLFCKSSMAKAFRENRIAEGCQAFLKYRFARDRRTGKMIELRGLKIRREKETALCLRG
jgi:lysozyme